jgi:hypothetical protein
VIAEFCTIFSTFGVCHRRIGMRERDWRVGFCMLSYSSAGRSVCRQVKVTAAFMGCIFSSRKCVISGFLRGTVEILDLVGR